MDNFNIMFSAVIHWINNHSLVLLRWSFGICYAWFGFLKFFPGLSPAEGLAGETIHILTFGLLSQSASMVLLAIWEVVVGCLFICGLWKRFTVWAMIVHMAFTLTPAFLMPQTFFTHFPYGLSLVGQYIIKNFVFISAGLILLKSLGKHPGDNHTAAAVE